MGMNVLRVLRNKTGLTQLALATRVGVTQSEISWAENDYKIRRLDKIAEFFARHETTREFKLDAPEDLMLDWDAYRDRQRSLVM